MASPPLPLEYRFQVLQQVWQIRIFDRLHLLVREFPEVLPACSVVSLSLF